MDAAVIAARLLQYAAAAGACGTALFLVYGHSPPDPTPWRRWVARASLMGALAALAWLMAQAGQFGEPADAFEPAKVWVVAAETGFGRAALIRIVLFLLAALFASRGAWNGAALAGGLASASFAFSGHTAAGEGLTGFLGLAADMIHAVAASVWLGALPALLTLLLARRREDARLGLERFSAIGPAVVAALAVTGVVNRLLIGPVRLGGLWSDPYSRTLSIKLALFAAMLALAAVNRWRLTSHLAAGGRWAHEAVTASILAETLLGLAVLALVAGLGTLPPPA